MSTYDIDIDTKPLLSSEIDLSEGIPTWGNLQQRYSVKWEEEKTKFCDQLKEKFKEHVKAWRSGKVEIYQLQDGQYSHHYERAFRELFADTGYQATVGESSTNPSGNKKFKPLYITLPDCFSSR